MARGNRYNIVKDKIHVGMKSFGWKCKEEIKLLSHPI